MASRRRRRLVFSESYPKTPDVASGIGRMLLRHGIHEFFGQGLPQGLSLPFEELGLRQIAYRTENGGGYMADGYARVSKRPAS